MDKRKLSENMKSLDNLLWKYASMQFNMGALNRSVISNVNDNIGWVVTLSNSSSVRTIDILIDKLEKAVTFDFEIFRPTPYKFYIVPTTTEDEKYNLLELKAYTVGQEVLEAQKKVLDAKERWVQPLKDLAAAKKQRERA